MLQQLPQRHWQMAINPTPKPHLFFASGQTADTLRGVVRKALATLKRLREEALALLDDRRMASQDQDLLHPFKRFLHFWVMVGRSFVQNRCMVRATALAYTTLLSLIPLLAVGLGVTTSLIKTDGDQTHDWIERVVDNLAPQLGLFPEDTPMAWASPQATADQQGPGTVTTVDPAGEPESGDSIVQETSATGDDPASTGENAREAVIQTIQGFVDNINSAGLNVMGMVALIVIAIGLLSTIEATFNDIWGVARGRRWQARLVQYWAAITLGPLILVVATTFAVGSHVEVFQDKVFELAGPGLATFGQFLLGVGTTILPLLMVSIAFTLLYQLMPATAVEWKAAAIGGGVGGLLWWLNGQLSVVFASKVISVSRIYGPFGILPVFLLGLYLSWLILLFGCQVSYAYQNRRTYLQEKQAEVMSPSGLEFLALRIMTLVGHSFHAAQPPPTLCGLSDELGISSRLLLQVIQGLRSARLLSQTPGPDPGYLPARPLNQITCADVLQVLRDEPGDSPKTREGVGRATLEEVYKEIRSAGETAAKNHSLLELVRRSKAADKPV
jgi:membrane protein